MESFIKEFILKNLAFKIGAIFCAFLIWLIVINVQNPIISRNFESPLEIRNSSVLENSGLVLLNHNSIANTLTGVEISFRENIDITQNQVSAYIDISSILESLGEIESFSPITVPVKYEINTVFSDSMFSVRIARNVTLNLDKVDTISMPVNINVSGDLGYGLTLEEVIHTPEYIEITGPTSQLQDVYTVVVNLSAEDISEDHAQFHNFLVLDEAGNNITSRFSFSPETVFLSTGLTRSAVVPVHAPIFSGSVAQGFTRGTFNFSPTSVTIYGKPIDVAEINNISLGVIDVSGISYNMTYAIDLRDHVPEAVNILGDYIVNVYINVVPVVIAPPPTPLDVVEEEEEEPLDEYEEEEYEYEDEDDEEYAEEDNLPLMPYEEYDYYEEDEEGYEYEEDYEYEEGDE